MAVEHNCCKFDSEVDLYGAAVDRSYWLGGQLWITNGEYASQVNYCPWCGKRAIEEAVDIYRLSDDEYEAYYAAKEAREEEDGE